jgi:hypothetical protein
VLLSEVDQLLVVHGASADDDHVVSEVVGSLEVGDMFTCKLADVVNVTEDWLAHHVLSVDVIVDVLHQSLLRILVSCFKFLPDCVFFNLDVLVVKGAVANHVAQNLNRLGESVWEGERVIQGMLSRCVCVKLGA